MIDAENMEILRGHLATVELRPGDRLVLTTPHRLSMDVAAQIEELIERWAPGHKCIILCDGIEMGVVRGVE